MRTRIPAIVCSLLAVLAVGAIGIATTGSAERRVPVLRDAAPTQRALIDRLLHALAANDPDALRRLRLTESEYREIVLPGSVAVGQPLRTYPDAVSAYAWGSLDTKSFYHERVLLQDFAGKRLSVDDVAFERGTETYATHTAHKQLRLTVTAADGSRTRLRTGSIAEIGGQYKFISFIRD